MSYLEYSEYSNKGATFQMCNFGGFVLQEEKDKQKQEQEKAGGVSQLGHYRG